MDLNQKDDLLSRKHAGKILNAENLKVLNSNVVNSSLADDVTIQNSSNISNSDISEGGKLSNTSLNSSSLGLKSTIKNTDAWRLSAGDDVEVDNMTISLSRLDDDVHAIASDPFKAIDSSSVSAGVHVKNSSMTDSSATAGTIIENADIKRTDLKGSSKVVDSDVFSEDFVRRPIFGLNISGGSTLEHAGEIGRSLTIRNSNVSATKIEQNVTIEGGSNTFFNSSDPSEKLEIGAFSTLSDAFVINSSLGSSVEVKNSDVGDSTLGDGAKVLNSSGVVSDSTLGDDVIVKNLSWVNEATLLNGITVDSSRVEFVSISQDKKNNNCNPDNVDQPSTYIDEFGNEVENPCYNPLYFPGE